jgi:acyl-CoA synthetase (AMP-forming)/AMP-acid ligase II
VNVGMLLSKSASTFSDRPALTIGTAVKSDYAAFHRSAERVAGLLRHSFDLRDEDRVAMAMTNSPAFYEILFGIWYAGLIAVPMNPKLHPEEFAYIAENSGARALFASPTLAPTLAPLAGRTGRLERVIEVGADSREVTAGASPLAAVHKEGQAPAWLFYTSGTTGRPKGATLSHRNLMTMTLSYFADVDRISPTDCILHAAPMSHGSGLYGLAHVAKAANNVIPQSGGFDSEEIFDLLQHHPGLTIFAAPTMVVRLMKSAPADCDTKNLKLICYGGGPMYVADTERALDLFGPKLVQIYGQGESPMTISYLPRKFHADRDHPRFRDRLGSVGIARTDVEIRVVGEDDKELPFGEIGEVVVRGDVVMNGYWDNPEATAESLRGGWLHTGDVGAMDGDGLLTLKDRSKDLIISGGTNIYPREVEEVLLRHPDIAETAVVGRPDQEWGEEVVAFVVARPGQTLLRETLDRHCLEHMARFKRPRRYYVELSLPKNNYGKVLKRSLRERLKDDDLEAL